MTTTCFVCSFKTYEFERSPSHPGFRHHVKNEHCMWSYLKFFLLLDAKEETEYSAQELYVHRKLLAKDLSFFPINRAMGLREGSDAMDERLASLERSVQYLVEKEQLRDRQQQELIEREKQSAWERTVANHFGDDNNGDGGSGGADGGDGGDGDGGDRRHGRKKSKRRRASSSTRRSRHQHDEEPPQSPGTPRRQGSRPSMRHVDSTGSGGGGSGSFQ